MSYRKKILLTFVLSILVHLVVIFLLLLIPEKSKKMSKPIIKQRYRITFKKKKREKKKKKKEKKEFYDLKNKQIVDIARPDIEKTPTKTKYMARYNSKVEKETVAKRVDNITTKKPSKKNLTIIKKKKNQKKRVEKKRKRVRSVNKTVIKNVKEKKREIKKEKADKKIAMSKDKMIKEKKAKKVDGNEESGDESFKKKEITFDYSDYDFSKMLRTSNDYLEGVEAGEVTSINTLANVYTGYYIKLKNRLSKEWDPLRAYQKNDPYRKRYGIKDRRTVLTVSIKKDGYLKNIKIKESSGLKFLDNEAIRAFEMAQPYKIVPTGILRGKGFFTINFGFIVDNPSTTSVFYIR